jgi:hypothetical protein
MKTAKSSSARLISSITWMAKANRRSLRKHPTVRSCREDIENSLPKDPQLDMALRVLKAWPAFQKAAQMGS